MNSGAPVEDLPLHREPLFKNFSMERASQVPHDLKRKLKVARQRIWHLGKGGPGRPPKPKTDSGNLLQNPADDGETS